MDFSSAESSPRKPRAPEPTAEELTIASLADDIFAAFPNWLDIYRGSQHPSPRRRIAKTREIVGQYLARGYPPESVSLWIRHAQLYASKPEAFLLTHLDGYGRQAWKPKTKAGATRKLHAAILRGDMDAADKFAIMERSYEPENRARREAQEFKQTLNAHMDTLLSVLVEDEPPEVAELTEEELQRDPDYQARIQAMELDLSRKLEPERQKPHIGKVKPVTEEDRRLIAIQQQARRDHKQAMESCGLDYEGAA